MVQWPRRQKPTAISMVTKIKNIRLMPCSLLTYQCCPWLFMQQFKWTFFQIISEAGADVKLTPQEIASRLATRNPDEPMMLDCILSLLATHSVVTCSVDVDDRGDPQRRYGLAPVSNDFIQNGDGVSLGSLQTLAQDKVFLDGWHVTIN
ncbi:hypothetical protein SLE2022_355710 [Rubroshorea leprosula]